MNAPILIFTRSTEGSQLGVWGRMLAAAVAGASAALLILAAAIQPNASGMASHVQLGFQSCQFLGRSGLPCPSCGMTTSFAWFVRGNLLASLYVQPMGAALAGLTAATFWATAYIAATGRPAYRLLRELPLRYYLLPILLFGVLAWAWKIFIHLNGLDGWG